MSSPLSAGEDTFELHSVQRELEAVEKQAQLQERRSCTENLLLWLPCKDRWGRMQIS